MKFYFLLHYILIVAVELPVYLYFFREDKMTAVHFSFLCNAFTYFLTRVLITKAGANYYVVNLLVLILESIIVFYFWNVDLKKAIIISLIANGASFLLFEAIDKINL